MSAVDIRTRDCKIAGCTGIAEATTGAYALLCHRHREERKRDIGKKMSDAGRRGGVASADTRTLAASGTSTVDATRELLRLAADVDKAQARAAAIKARAEKAIATAKADYRTAIEAVDTARAAHRDALRALLTDDSQKEQS